MPWRRCWSRMAVMAVMLSVAMPTWSHMIRREKEEELIFRGTQYARAINQYQRKFANASPASLDVLIEQRLLRKKFRDPLSPNKDGEFQMLYLQNQGTMRTARRGRAHRFARHAGAGDGRVPEWAGLSGRQPTPAAVQSSASPARTRGSRFGLQGQDPLQRVAVHRNGDVGAGRPWWRGRTRWTSARWTRRSRQRRRQDGGSGGRLRRVWR